jgi:septum formation protein
MPTPLPPLILASASPRRRALLAALVPDFTVVVADVDETPAAGEPAEAYARRIAVAKARAVAASQSAGWVLGADTTVALHGQVLGKPADADEARAMLRALRDRRHEVLTALALVDAVTGEWHLSAEVTGVWLRPYSAAEVEDYIATGDPFDKAGGYAIQHPVFRPVARLVGSETNVIGLPLGRLSWLLARR